MRWAPIEWAGCDGGPRWAAQDSDSWRPLGTGGFPSAQPREDLFGPPRSDAEVRLCAPAVGKVVCVGRNYAKHAAELQNTVPEEPLLFLKPASSVIGPGRAIERPVHMSSLIHHEGELAVLIGRALRDASEAEALEAVAAYTCANDVTARDLQRSEGKFTRAKGFDTFCPLGPIYVTPDELGDPQALSLKVTVSGELRQDGNTRDMVFGVGLLLSFISRVMTLNPGDVVLTGTPEGVGPLEAGDTVSVEISGIGRLENPVVDRAPPA
jgi:2-keto-4-pentenoate hydratase/2-oxohepta-3-ene-1,7-dioic acid hydratase in catechol pathway